MRPPICAICDDDFGRRGDQEGDLLWFKETEKDIAESKRKQRYHLVSHPGNAEWFCSRHVEAARELTHLTVGEAMDILLDKYSAD